MPAARRLPTTPYDPKAVEARLYAHWERSGYFHEEPDPARPPFIICMPPPNVTGRAHLGHGSTYAPMDVLVRYHRMLGDNADWLPGTDHAAIATEAKLVQELKREGTTRDALGRERFVGRAWEWSRAYGGEINEAFRALGFGADWKRARFTMDEGLSAAVRRVFVRLYRDGLIYRAKRLVNWDPVAKTTISDAEVEHEEREAALYYVRYPLAGGSVPLAGDAGIVVATTRPETMLADVAVAVHPDDERYRALVGRRVRVPPLLEREIPVIADGAVDPSFGTGAVKVTPAHDAADFEIGERHGLAMPSIMALDATITGSEIDAGKYEGLDRFSARAEIVEDLQAAGLLERVESHRHAIALSERTGAVIEPLLLEQWFVNMTSLAKPALDAYRSGRVRFVPERYGRTYEQWLSNIRDWNVSRQVWWGHQLPVWYTPAGDPVVAESEEEARHEAGARHGTRELTRDPDTLDTWFSSALWPFSILGWPEQTPELQCWYPSQTLVTGGEIIFLWVARMAMLGIYVMGGKPFTDVFIAPLVFDAQGRKMSKSLGNAIDPMDLSERYGADAFRMGMLRQLRLEAQEVRFQESRCEEARNFNNKIWNALRYVLQLPEEPSPPAALPPRNALTLADRWILTLLHDAIVEVTRLLDAYDFGNAVERLWHFIWYEFCDWFVETTKMEGSRETRVAVLSFVLNNAMRLLHPFEPFISEETWLSLPHDGDTIVTAAWPDPLEVPVDREAAARFALVRSCIVRLRDERAAAGVKPGRARARSPQGLRRYAQERDLIGHLAAVDLGETPSSPEEGSLTDMLFDVHVLVPVEHLTTRYRKECERLRAEVERGQKKLANEEFVRNAKPDVVEKEREKLERYRSELERVEQAMSDIAS